LQIDTAITSTMARSPLRSSRSSSNPASTCECCPDTTSFFRSTWPVP
jgi:hypothetical protein